MDDGFRWPQKSDFKMDAYAAHFLLKLLFCAVIIRYRVHPELRKNCRCWNLYLSSRNNQVTFVYLLKKKHRAT